MARTVTQTANRKRYALCVRNTGYPASLEVRKVYRVKGDREGSSHGLIRVIDESGESYLYPERYFVDIELPKAAEKLLSTSN